MESESESYRVDLVGSESEWTRNHLEWSCNRNHIEWNRNRHAHGPWLIAIYSYWYLTAH